MKQITLILFILFLIGCKQNQDKEIDKLYKIISTDNQFNTENLEVGHLIVSERYNAEWKMYHNAHRLIGDMIAKIDSIRSSGFGEYNQTRDFFQIKIDKLDPIVKDVNKNNRAWTKSYNHNGQYDTIDSKDYLRDLMIEVNDKLINSNKKNYSQDLRLSKLYLTLIERNIICTLNREISAKTFDVDYIEPVIIKRKDYVDCYITAIDNANKNYILIGDFDESQGNKYTHYKTKKIYDTIWIHNAHARIKNNIFKKGEAILHLTQSDGTWITKKIK